MMAALCGGGRLGRQTGSEIKHVRTGTLFLCVLLPCGSGAQLGPPLGERERGPCTCLGVNSGPASELAGPRFFNCEIEISVPFES